MITKLRKPLVMAMVLAIIFSTFSFGLADPYKPVLGVVAEDEVQVVKAGERTEYTVTIKNASYVVAQGIRVSIKGAHPFRSDIANLTQTVSYLNPNDVKKFVFSVTPSPTAVSKVYEFDLEIEYSNFEDTSYTQTEKIYVKVENGNNEPILGVTSYSTGQSELMANTPDSLALNIKNTGASTAKDVKVVVSGFSNEGVVLYKEVDTKTFDELDAKGTQLTYFNIIAGKDAKEGSFPINVSISYIDEMGNVYKKDSIAYVTLAGKGAVDADLAITNVQYPVSVKANETFNVTFKVENKGNVEISTADLTIEYPETFISKTASKVVIKNLAPGASQNITFKLMPKEETTTENYHTYIKASYIPKGGSAETPETIQEYVGIYVQGKDDDAASEGSKPKLIIDYYDYGGEYVYAGEDYPLTLKIKNTSNVEGTKNIKVTLTSEENVFTPVDSSSSFFIASIGPGEVYTHTVYLKTKIDANVKIYTLTAKMEYEDSKGNAYDENKTPYSESEVLSIAVSQPVRLETAEVIVPFEIFTGQPFYIEQEFYNMGKSTMYNMIVKLEGVETTEGSYFVGNFESGKSEYFSAQAFAYEVGTFEGKLVYSFEDALGTVSTLEQPFTINVTEMPIIDDGGFPVDPNVPVEEETGGLKAWQIIVAAVVALAIVGFVVRKVLKSRKLKKELEDLDE
jgi:hypothetical protein